MHISGRKHETKAVAGGPERNKRRECQRSWRERCASQVVAGRPGGWLRKQHNLSTAVRAGLFPEPNEVKM
jgi:hypothetical protein